MDLQQILEHAVRLYADRTAVVCGTTRMTYRGLAERVHRLCQALQALPCAFTHLYGLAEAPRC